MMRILVISLLYILSVRALAPGGFIEKSYSPTRREFADLSFVPSTRGTFTIPEPYNTKAYRITEAADGTIEANGYSYWAKMNNHVDSDVIHILVGGGVAPASLYTLNKETDEVLLLGKVGFPTDGFDKYLSPADMYWDRYDPYTFHYVATGAQSFNSFNIMTNTTETLFTITDFYPDTRITQTHRSFDGNIVSFTLRTLEYTDICCAIYIASNNTVLRYDQYTQGGYDECQVDKSGRYLLIKTQLDNQGNVDAVHIDILTGQTRIMYNPKSIGHSDNGYGAGVGPGDWNNYAPSLVLWDYDRLIHENLDYHALTFVYTTDPGWYGMTNHISWTNAKDPAIVPYHHQFICGSWSDSNIPWAKSNEIICFRGDNSSDLLVVAPSMTWMNATGGSIEYYKAPKAVLDFTGDYILWSSNTRSDRLDIYVAQVPWHLLVAEEDYNPPPVAPVMPEPPSTAPSGAPVSAGSPNANPPSRGPSFSGAAQLIIYSWSFFAIATWFLM